VVPVIILAIVLAAAALGVGAVLGGKSKSSATTQSPGSSQPQAPNKQSAASKKQSQVSKWANKNGSKIQGLAKSMKATADADVAAPNTGALRSACQGLRDATRAAAGVLPAPNATLTNALRGAIDHFDRAAQECITGVDGENPAARDQFRSDLGAGQNQVGVAAYILERFDKGG
jgi:cell division septum initiation protein DivIVA